MNRAWLNLWEQNMKPVAPPPPPPITVWTVPPGRLLFTGPPWASQEQSGASCWACSSRAPPWGSAWSGPSGTGASFCGHPQSPDCAPPWRTPPPRSGGASGTWTPLGHRCSSCSWWSTGAWPCCWTPPHLVSPPPHRRRLQSSCLCRFVRTSSAAMWGTLTWYPSGGRQSPAASWWPGCWPPAWPPSASHTGPGRWSSPPGSLWRRGPARPWPSPETLHTPAPSLASSALWRTGNEAWPCSGWLWWTPASWRHKAHHDVQLPKTALGTSEPGPSPAGPVGSSQVEQPAACGRNQTSGTGLPLGFGSCTGTGSTSRLWLVSLCWTSSSHSHLRSPRRHQRGPCSSRWMKTPRTSPSRPAGSERAAPPRPPSEGGRRNRCRWAEDEASCPQHVLTTQQLQIWGAPQHEGSTV